MSALQLENLAQDADGILIANNTAFMCASAFRLWDDSVKGKNIQVCNNLILGAASPDMIFLDSGGDPLKPRGPGDGRLLHQAWKLSHNWREVKTPKGKGLLEESWIPPGPDDVRQDAIEVLSRDPLHADFLRPASTSPLARQGAGTKDPSLPAYVGALPPQGAQPWDWDKTWKARGPVNAQSQ